MSQVKIIEVVEALTRSLTVRLDLVERIEAHGIAPPDGWVLVNEATAKEFLSYFNCEAENTTGTRLYNKDLQTVVNAFQMLAAAPKPEDV